MKSLIEIEETEARVKDRVLKLPRAERLIIYLYFWEKLTPKEISIEVGITEVMVWKLINIGLGKLKLELRLLETAA